MNRALIVAFLPLMLLGAACVPPAAQQVREITPTSTTTPAPAATDTPSPTNTPVPLFTVKVMTYNILYGAGVDRKFDKELKAAGQYENYGKNRLPGLLSVIKEWNPDVLGLEEVAGWNSGNPSVMEQVASELNMNYYLAPGGSDNLKVAILSKYKIMQTRDFAAEFGVRGLLAQLESPDGQLLNVFVVHLASKVWAGNDRAEEIKKLVPVVEPFVKQRTVMMGDFNTGPYEWELQPLRDLGIIPVVRGGIGLDLIWISPAVHWSTTDWSRAFNPTMEVSDHLPVGAEFMIFP